MTEKRQIVRRPTPEHGLVGLDAVARTIAQPSHGEDEVSPREVWAGIRRNRWLILACMAAAVAVAAFLTSRATPVYQATATLKVEVKQSNLPGIYVSSSEGGVLGTEARVLESRTLAESAATALALQLRLAEPHRVPRAALFDSITVAHDAAPGTYRLQSQDGGQYALLADSTPAPLASVRPGDQVRLPGVAFRLSPGAVEHESIVFSVISPEQAASVVLAGLTVEAAARDVNILTIGYESTDPELVWQVPNTIVDRYLARRRELARAEARSTADFLRQQLDTLSTQLATAEDALRDYRQRHRAIDPQSEATGQVQRLIEMEAERGSIEGEREALERLLAEVDAKAAQRRPDDPSPYRELLAFPSLLRSPIATGLLQSLGTAEQERAELLSERTMNDEDVQLRMVRVKELEGQVRGVVVTYLQGLASQVTTLDASLEKFGQQLGQLPQRELEVARLERKPKVLDEISALLERRLKEAEIAQAAGDPSVQVLDRAAPPGGPFKPNRTVNLLAGMLIGLLLGGVGTFVREYRDRTVHSRREVEIATGLPVLGLIPTIDGRRWSSRRIPLITEALKRRGARTSAVSSAPPSQPSSQPLQPPSEARPIYTFFGSVPAPEETSVRDSAPITPAASADNPIQPPASVKMALTPAGSPVAEAYGVLQTNIAFALRDRPVQLIVVTSALSGEGKTTNAVNLALSLTRRGLRVVLVDGDLRRGEVHTAFEVPRGPGLTEVLRGSVSFAQACRSVEVEGTELHFVTTGAAVPSPTSLLDSEALRDLLAQLRERYDIIVIDSPPTNIVTDAAVLGALADGVILVARVGVTEAGALGTAIHQLHHVRATMLGVVLNDINFKRDASYDASYRYYNYGQYLSSTSS